MSVQDIDTRCGGLGVEAVAVDGAPRFGWSAMLTKCQTHCEFGIDELTAWVDMPLPETVGCIDMGDQKVIADETVREVLLNKCGARTIPEFQLHTKDRQKDIVRDVMRELGAGPRQMVRVCGLTYAVVYKMWKDL